MIALKKVIDLKKVIALKKVISQMMQKHNPDDGGKHITEFKKRKRA